MSSSSEAAYAEAKRLMEETRKTTATSQDRRKFFDNLISLCSYPSLPCKAFFGTMVFKHFAEFEDLQDRAIDAILDLCEDEQEKVRMIGIRSLGATAKADSRWVRGNTGVLLQLLECPPKELELVHQALFTILSVNPSDVFAVMADDCKGSEEETGASRRNILDFLNRDAAEARRNILESGDHVGAEESFRKGFESVLEATALAETRIILGLLMPLSTISGKNATRSSSDRFCRLLTDSLHPNSSTALTIPLVKIFADFVGRLPPLDPRECLRILACHGGAVTTLALEKDDKIGKDLIHLLRTWTDQAAKDWRRKDGEADLKEEKLVPQYSKTIIGAVLDQVKRSRSVIETSVPELETLIWSVVELMVLEDRRRTIISDSDSRGLDKLAREVSAIIKRTRSENRAFQTIRQAAEILADPRKQLEIPTPSWRPMPTAPARPSAPSAAPTGPRSDRSRPLPSTPATAARQQTSARPPTPSRSAAQYTAPTTSTTLGSRSVPPVRDSHKSSNSRPPPVQAAQSTAAPVRPGPKITAPTPSLASRLSLTSTQSPTTLSAGPSRSQEQTPPPKTSSSRQGQELFPHLPTPSSQNSQAGIELFPAKSLDGQESVRQPEQPTPAPRSLADRLAPASNKRQRDESEVQTEETRPSLLSRLSLNQEGSTREIKKPRSSLPETSTRVSEQRSTGNGNANGSSSLLSRLSNNGREATSRVDPGFHRTVSSPPSAQVNTAPQGFSIRKAAVPPKTEDRQVASPTPSLSIFGRSTPQPIPQSLNIKNRSNTNTPVSVPEAPRPTLSIRSVSRDGVEEGVIRKGRGFSKVDNDGDIIMVPKPSFDPAVASPKDGLRFAPKGLRRPVGNGGRW